MHPSLIYGPLPERGRGARTPCALETLLILWFNVQIIRAFLQKSVSVVWTEPIQALSGDSKDPA